MSCKFKPLSDRLIIKPEEEEKVTKSGIVLPDTAKEKPTLGRVIEVGPGKTNDKGETTPMTVKKDDVVLHSKYGGTEIKIDDEDYLILSESDVLAIKAS